MPDPVAARSRLDSIDFVRGVVMVVMLLDHTRDFAHSGSFLFRPAGSRDDDAALYLTRWITHLCAPTFVFLAGLAPGLKRLRGTSRRSCLAFSGSGGSGSSPRGLCLPFPHLVQLRLTCSRAIQVIWAIGVSMIVLAALVRLPFALRSRRLARAHRARAQPARRGAVRPTGSSPRRRCRTGRQAVVPGSPGRLLPATAAVPEPGRLGALSLAALARDHGARLRLAQVYGWPAERRRRVLIRCRRYGRGVPRAPHVQHVRRPSTWRPRGDVVKSAMSFFDVAKYPPSLLFASSRSLPRCWSRDSRRPHARMARLRFAFDFRPRAAVLLFPAVADGALAGNLDDRDAGKERVAVLHGTSSISFARAEPPTSAVPSGQPTLWASGVFLLYWPCRWYAGSRPVVAIGGSAICRPRAVYLG